MFKLDLHEQAQQASPLPVTFTDVPAPAPVDAAVAAQLAHLTSLATGNSYFKSLDALLALAAYRFSVFAESLPFVLVFVFASIVDGAMRRIVKSHEFLRHDPEMYALCASVAIMLACATVVAFVIPLSLHPAFFVAVPICIGLFVSVALANFHRRG